MKRLARSGVFAAVLLGVWSVVFLGATAQDRPSAAKPPCTGCSVDGKTTPRLPDGHPSLNGFWQNAQLGGSVSTSADGSVVFNLQRRRGRICDEDSCQQPNQPPYKPAYAAKVKEIGDSQSRGTSLLDPQFACKPLGVPRGGTGTMQIVQTPEMVAILYEEGPGPIWRLIYTDGRSHPKNLDTSYLGHSIGHWEGDTLVVDVIGLNEETWLGGGLPGDQKYTSIHSDQEHVIERWTRTGDTIAYEATVEDPVMFTRPWVMTPRQIKIAAPSDEILEGLCVPDDRIRPDKLGK